MPEEFPVGPNYTYALVYSARGRILPELKKAALSYLKSAGFSKTILKDPPFMPEYIFTCDEATVRLRHSNRKGIWSSLIAEFSNASLEQILWFASELAVQPDQVILRDKTKILPIQRIFEINKLK